MNPASSSASRFLPMLLAAPACATGVPASADVRVADAAPASSSSPSPSSFDGLYKDIFSATGAARCQSPMCHGGSDGEAGLSMGTTARDVYRAITHYTYEGSLLVQPQPGGDARLGSILLVVIDPDEGIMPRLDETVGNRKLTREEWRRIETWLRDGGQY